jgi:hypothetical protein
VVSFPVGAVGAVAGGQGRVVDPVGQAAGVFGVDQREVVDAGGWPGWFGRGFRAGLGVGVPGDLVRQRPTGVDAVCRASEFLAQGLVGPDPRS